MTAESIAMALVGRKARVCNEKGLSCSIGTVSYAGTRNSGMATTE